MKRNVVTPALRISLIYLIVSVLWIQFSDRALEAFAPSVEALTQLQSVKGMGFVGFTAMGLYVLMSRELVQREREQKARIEAVSRSEQYLRSILQEMPIMFLARDAKGIILAWNRECERVTGYAASEMIGNPNATRLLQPEEESYREVLRRMAEGNNNYRDYEYRLTARDGTKRTVMWSNISAQYPIPGWGSWGVGMDITERVNAQQQLKEINEQLDQRVEERTAELSAANARLKELDQMKSKFVADVSHELKTPLTNINMYIYLIERESPDKVPGYIAILKEQVARLRGLVENVLDLSRLDFAEPTLIFDPVDLNTVIQQTISAHVPRAESKGLTLDFQAAPELPQVRGVHDQLLQVTHNLIANAINYTDQGSITVRTGFDVDHKRAYLMVKDTGIGIPEDELPRLFERFYRGSEVVRQHIPGTGLGLNIVKEIVDLHGGTIYIESEQGNGSTFTVTLPVATDPELHAA
jgi:PAS domain S-box-containing protein